MDYTIAVFGKTLDESREFLLKLIKDIPDDKIKNIWTSNSSYKIILEGGVKYIALIDNITSRGYKYHKAYISKKISSEISLSNIYSNILYWNDKFDENDVEFY